MDETCRDILYEAGAFALSWNFTHETEGPFPFHFTHETENRDHFTSQTRPSAHDHSTSRMRLNARDHCLHARDWRPLLLHFTHETESPWPLHFTYSHGWKLRSQSTVASHWTGGTNSVKWMQDGCKVYMDSYMASNGSHFIVALTIFKNHLLDVGLTQSHEILAF
jgi:hypothetical protein